MLWYVVIVYVLDYCVFFFFFQAEDGIRDLTVTGVQTCALPIYAFGEHLVLLLERRRDLDGAGLHATDRGFGAVLGQAQAALDAAGLGARDIAEIGRASCRERV